MLLRDLRSVVGINAMIRLLNNFMEMPSGIRILCCLGLIFPAISVSSVLSGEIAYPLVFDEAYGVARNLFELILVGLASVPMLIGAALMLTRHRSGGFVYPLGLLASYFSPFMLAAFRETFEYIVLYALSGVIAVAFVSGYIFMSRDVDRYFRNAINTN